MTFETSTKETIQRLFEEHADSLYRYVLYALPNQYDARDVVQEVFLRAYKSWDGFKHESSEKTWLFTIARNLVYDLLRKKRTETEYLARYKKDTPVSTDLGSTMEYEELLLQLSERDRQIILLRAIEGLSVSETAEVLGISEANVRLTFFRAKNRFAKLLGDQAPRGQTSKGGFD